MALVSVCGFQCLSGFSPPVSANDARMVGAVRPALSANMRTQDGLVIADLDSGGDTTFALDSNAARILSTLQTGGAPSSTSWTHANTRVTQRYSISRTAALRQGKTIHTGMKMIRRTAAGAATTRGGPPVQFVGATTEDGVVGYIPASSTAAADVYVEVSLDLDTNTASVYYDGTLATTLTVYECSAIVFGCYPSGNNGALGNVSVAAGEKLFMENQYLVVDTVGETPTGRLGAISLIQSPATSAVVTPGSFNPTDTTSMGSILNNRVGTTLPTTSALGKVESLPGVITIPAIGSSSVPSGRDLIGFTLAGVCSRGEPSTPAALKMEMGATSTSFNLGSKTVPLSSAVTFTGQAVYCPPEGTPVENVPIFVRLGSVKG